MVNKAYFYAIGKRKTARATVKLFPEGDGNLQINGQSFRDWADDQEMYFKMMQPLELLGVKKNYDFEIRTSGGGKKAQAEAVRLGLSRSLVRKNPEYRAQLKEAGFLTRDQRKKERKKPGLKRARRAPQWAKR